MRYKQVDIGGKEYPIAFTTLAVSQYCIRHKYEIGDVLQKVVKMQPKEGDNEVAIAARIPFSVDEMITMLHEGLKEGHRKAKKEWSGSRLDAADLADEKPGLLIEVFGLFTESLTSLFGADDSATETEGNPKPQGKQKAKN